MYNDKVSDKLPLCTITKEIVGTSRMVATSADRTNFVMCAICTMSHAVPAQSAPDASPARTRWVVLKNYNT